MNYTVEDYWKRYAELVPVTKSDKEAWLILEEEVYDQHGVKRYISYISFRRCKSYHFKTKSQKSKH